jgi:hypothetical protein
VKHFFHFIFTGSLLLVSLIVFNVQNPESDRLVSEEPDIKHVELQAEVCLYRTYSHPVSSTRENSDAVCNSISASFSRLEGLLSAEQKVRGKRQTLIYLEIKPVLGIRCGHNLGHPSMYEDPPLS